MTERSSILSTAITRSPPRDVKAPTLVVALWRRARGEGLKEPGAERYKLGKTLGAGAFASVRQATDASTGRDVAVKLMSKTKTSETAAKKERELLAALCKKEPHPNIVNLLDAFDTPTSWALVLELVTGGEVFDRVLRNQGAFSETDAASVQSAADRARAQALALARHCPPRFEAGESITNRLRRRQGRRFRSRDILRQGAPAAAADMRHDQLCRTRDALGERVAALRRGD